MVGSTDIGSDNELSKDFSATSRTLQVPVAGSNSAPVQLVLDSGVNNQKQHTKIYPIFFTNISHI